MSNPNNYTETYLEQGLNSLDEAWLDSRKVNLVRKVFEEKMRWAYENGLINGRAEGVDMAEKSLGVALNELRETM